MNTHLALRLIVSSLLVVLARASFAAPVVPPDFAVENALVNNTLFNNPTAITTLPDGRWLVAEKRGVVWVVTNGVKSAQPLWSGTAEVLNSGDRGLISVAVDPAYASNRRVYFFYSVDPDSDEVDDAAPSFGRVVRYETSAADANVVDPASRFVLIGRSYRDGITSASLSHGADDLRFGEDGSLLVSHGDGAHYESADFGGQDPQQFIPGRSDPNEDIGCFRSQDVNSLSGKLLRINPESGHGYASNPFVAGDLAENRAKVWAYGLRNPFRFRVRPGTGVADTAAGRPGTIFLGDVGLNTWEEVNIVDRSGLNFGWPCREGNGPQAMFVGLAPAHHGCGTVGTTTDPLIAWHHTDSTQSTPYGIVGNCAAGGLFYDAVRYPAQYRGRFFFGDFGEGWLKVATFDSLNRVVQLQDFGRELGGPVDFAIDPVSGDILYVSIYSGQVRRIRWLGNGSVTQPLVAQASANVTIGDAPATFQFSSLGSYDPEGEPITSVWSFGDGTALSIENHPSHVYASSGEYLAILTVSSPRGTSARDTVKIVVAAAVGFPVAGVIDSLRGPDRALATPWTGSMSGLAVRNGALTQTASPSYATWNGGVFGANQEAYVRFDSVTAAAPEHALLLKTQGTSWAGGTIQVVYAAQQQVVVMSVYTPGLGWTRRGGPWRFVFGPGDQLGARAFSNGMVVVYKNASIIGTASVMGWPWALSGGRIGIKLVGATSSRMVDFGGGDVHVDRHTPPRARIEAPADRSFYLAHEQIVLRGSAEDDEEPVSSLDFRWGVDLIHNNHVHPSVHTFPAPVDSFEAEDHDDGTGVHYVANLFVTDPLGLVDTATVSLYPEVDLAVSPVVTNPVLPNGIGSTTYAFTLRNLGRMGAPRTRWALVADGVTLAQGDTLVAALDSVRIERALPSLLPGVYTLRAVADTLGKVVEPSESNNAGVSTHVVVDFPRTAVLDGFARPDGAMGAPWVGSVTGLALRNQALVATASSPYAVWNGAVFGPDQEAYVRFDSLTATSPEHDLLLKVQGTSWTAGAIQVGYSALSGHVVVNTYTPGSGWVRRAGPWKVLFAPGDQLGVRALGDGAVRVYRNGVKIGEASLASWPYANRGGRLGLLVRDAWTSRLTAFGGGSLTPPHAHILAPSSGSFYATGDRIVLRGNASDEQDLAATLKLRWIVDRVNGATESTAFTSIAATDSFVAGASAGSYRVRLITTDPFNLADTATVWIHPDVDLVASTAVTTPLQPTGVGVTTYAFTIANRGRMVSPTSRWVLRADGFLVAQGDTLVPAGDSVRIVRTVPSLPGGAYTLRAMADSLNAMIETSETNNAGLAPLTVVEFPGATVLDGFARPDGPITTPWVGSVSGLAVRNQAMVQNVVGSSYVIWNGGVFGADQEVWARFDSLTATSPEHDLLLKVQGVTWTAGAIQVVYSAVAQAVVVNTYTPVVGWARRAGPWKVTLAPGDQLGARALADGTVRVYKNTKRVGEVSLAVSWPFATQGGRIGLLLNRANNTRIAAFGGGDGRPDSGAINLSGRETTPKRPSPPSVASDAAVGAPRVLALSNPFPNPSRRAVALALDLPHAANVSFTVFDISGRRVWEAGERQYEAGRWTLRWPGVDAGGVAAAPGLYFAQARVAGRVYGRRIILAP